MPATTSGFVTAQDGLSLHVQEFGSRASARLPVVCLPGLARTAQDFHALASALAARGRRVLALDYRGRGLSDYDRNARNYSLPVELADTLGVLTARAAIPAVFVGTSRGGLLIMLLAAQRPTAIAGAILNDIGPVIEPKGLMRIKGYVGKLPLPRSFEEGAEILRRLFGRQFPKLVADDWLAAAQRMWRRDGERLVPTYDARLARTFATFTPESRLPALWPQFDALAAVPLMVIRGANSDLLSAETVAAMRTRRKRLDVMEVPDQGHTPLLRETDVIERIATFIEHCDQRSAVAPG